MDSWGVAGKWERREATSEIRKSESSHSLNIRRNRYSSGNSCPSSPTITILNNASTSNLLYRIVDSNGIHLGFSIRSSTVFRYSSPSSPPSLTGGLVKDNTEARNMLKKTEEIPISRANEGSQKAA
ncbi:hypothetical protein LINPERHAP2_LOCUS14813 [Linum perenne]